MKDALRSAVLALLALSALPAAAQLPDGDPLPPKRQIYQDVNPMALGWRAVIHQNAIKAWQESHDLQDYLRTLHALQGRSPSEDRAARIEENTRIFNEVSGALVAYEMDVPDGKRIIDVQESDLEEGNGDIVITRIVLFGDGTSESLEARIKPVNVPL
ncbi:MAG: hypothetical protein HYZ75_12220 [Elusimicrobia bacterium]|nr:hypothetical protein [Elusimicrobiota bacterium]